MNFWSELGTGPVFNTFPVAATVHLFIGLVTFPPKLSLVPASIPYALHVCCGLTCSQHLAQVSYEKPCAMWPDLLFLVHLIGSDWYFQEFCSSPEAFVFSSEYEKWERRVSRKETKTLSSMKWLQIQWCGVFRETWEVVTHTLSIISHQQLESSEALCEMGTNTVLSGNNDYHISLHQANQGVFTSLYAINTPL